MGLDINSIIAQARAMGSSPTTGQVSNFMSSNPGMKVNASAANGVALAKQAQGINTMPTDTTQQKLDQANAAQQLSTLPGLTTAGTGQQNLTDYKTGLQTNIDQTNAEATAAKNKYTGDVADFNKEIPLYRGQALGNLVSRGLSSSFDPNNASDSSGALGSMELNRFNNNVGDTLGNMADSFNQFQGNAALQQQARAQALQNFFNNQNYFTQQQENQKPGFGDFLGMGAGALSLI